MIVNVELQQFTLIVSLVLSQACVLHAREELYYIIFEQDENLP